MAARDQLQKFSKFMVYLCRHGAGDWGLEPDPDGWVDVAAVLKLRPARNLTRSHIRRVVNDYAGGRLELNEHGTAVRAIQGHSLHIRDDGFQRVTWDDEVPDLLIHGTNDASWILIKDQGLKPMGRQHAHMAQGLDAVHDYSTVHIYIDKAAVMNHGLELLIARNGVVLCRSTIPPDCFYSAWHVTQERELLRLDDRDWVVPEEVEENSRWKQIRLGQWTREYAVWMYSTDEDKARYPIAEPPDSRHHVLPKRRFLKELSAWRRGLHEFTEWLEEQHRRAGTEMRPLKRPRGSISEAVSFFGIPGQSSVGGAPGSSSGR